MKRIDNVKEKLKKNNVSSFSLMPILLVPYSLIVALLIACIISVLYLLFAHGCTALTFFLCGAGIIYLSEIIRSFTTPILFREKKDRKNGNILVEDVLLKYSQPSAITGLTTRVWYPNVIGILFWKEKAQYHCCWFRPLNKTFAHIEYNEKDFFYYVLTKEKLNELHCLCNLEASTWDYAPPFRCVKFHEGVPLRIVYWQKSRVLKEVLPVEGYEYTEDQLKAIEKINAMYP